MSTTHYTSGNEASVGGVDLTPYLRSISMVQTAPLLTNTTQGSANQTKFRGLPGYVVTCVFLQDFTALKVEATLKTAADADPALAACVFKSIDDARTWTGNFTFGDMQVVSAGEGSTMEEITVVFEAAGDITPS